MADNGGDDGKIIGRRKVRAACVPCKQRKRKCDGKRPCSSCLRFEYDCQYSRVKPSPTSASVKPASPALSTAICEGMGAISAEYSMNEATSGVAFSHAVATKHSGDQTLGSVGWNVGLSRPVVSDQPLNQMIDLPTLVAQEGMLQAVRRYSESIGKLYPIISLRLATALAHGRYRRPYPPQPLVDAALSALVALSYVFSGETNNEAIDLLTRYAKLCFEMSTENDPTDLHIIGWGLYTLLLRATGAAQVCWMASCTTVHLIDSLCAVQSPLPYGILLSTEEKWSLFTTSKLLHMWISFELGRPHIPTTALFADSEVLAIIVKKHTVSVLGLYLSTKVISPGPTDPQRLEDSFANVESFSCSNSDALALSRCILAMATFRRRLIQHPPVSSDLKARIIAIGREGLCSVERLLPKKAPWWHLINVPFQFLCLALVLGALNEAPAAMQSLRTVAATHPTDRVKRTLACAERMLEAIYAQRLGECRFLEESLGLDAEAMEVSANDFGLPSGAGGTGGIWNLPVNFDDKNWNMFPNTGAPIFDALS